MNKETKTKNTQIKSKVQVCIILGFHDVNMYITAMFAQQIALCCSSIL